MKSLNLYSEKLTKLGIEHLFAPPGSRLESNDGSRLEPSNVSMPRQVHGARVVQPVNLDERPADGLWLGQGAQWIGVQSADCVPVLLAHREGPVAAIHAGWRGMVQEIVERFLDRRAKDGPPSCTA